MLARAGFAPTPEERELSAKLAALAELEALLTERELERVTLRSLISDFESKYVSVVGSRLSRLDHLRVLHAQILAQVNPNKDANTRFLESARDTARKSQWLADHSQAATHLELAECYLLELKALYRAIAKRLHPDLSDDDDDRRRRNLLMAKLNEAYECRDIVAMRAVMEEWGSDPDVIKGEDTGAHLVRAIRRLARVASRLGEIASELKTLDELEMNMLRRKVLAAKDKGRDLLQEMASHLDAEVSQLLKVIEHDSQR